MLCLCIVSGDLGQYNRQKVLENDDISSKLQELINQIIRYCLRGREKDRDAETEVEKERPK